MKSPVSQIPIYVWCDGVMGSTQDFESCGPGSNLGESWVLNITEIILNAKITSKMWSLFLPLISSRFYGVMVSTQDSESCDLSSSLGRTSVLRAL